MAHSRVVTRVSSSSGRLMPSVPMWNRAPIAGIHFVLIWNCRPGCVALHRAGLETSEAGAEAAGERARAVHRPVDDAAVDGIHVLRKRVLDRLHDPAEVQVVQVVLVLGERVRAAEPHERLTLLP